MNKILFVVCFFCVGVAYFFYKESLYQKNRYIVSNANNQLLLTKMKEMYNEKVETDRTNEELRQAVARDKTDCFNWDTSLGSSVPIVTLKRMHKDRNSLR